ALMSRVDVVAAIRHKYMEDKVLGPIVKNPRDYQDYVYEDRLMRVKCGDTNVLCIPDVTIEGKCVQGIIIDEAHSLLAHLGTRKTLDYLRGQVWWKDMTNEVDKFCESC
ncbi:hypothetical protein P691DRAFT_640214, partial [Macrolepiota fuliginosa MF-IS2]